MRIEVHKLIRRATVFGVLVLPASLSAQTPGVSGYWQLLPTFTRQPDSGTEQLDLQLQNRLASEWWVSDQWRLVGGLRSRLLTGDTVRNTPSLAGSLDQDPGYVDLSAVPYQADHTLVHVRPDRLYAEWSDADWSIRAGRQRVNWGVNVMTNPNDLFNTYAFYDFEYPERPGADAIRVQRYLGFASRIEVAASLAGSASDDPVAAALYATNHAGYDWQWLAGTYQDRLALGMGWAGAIGTAGFKGEATWFRDTDTGVDEPTNLVVATGLDTVLANGAFVMTEMVFNPGYDRSNATETGAISGLSPDNPTPALWQHTGQVQYSASPLLSLSLAGTWYPGASGGVLAPSLTASLARNWEGRLLVQWIRPPHDQSAEQQLIAASLRWDFS